jgi:acid phosphatase
MLKRLGTFATLAAATIVAAGCSSSSSVDGGLQKLNHIVVIYLENHSYDNLYGEFAGSENLSSSAATNAPKQIGPDGNPYTTLPQPVNTNDGGVDTDFPANLPNAPWDIDQYVDGGAGYEIPDVIHRFYQEQAQINDAGMSYFALVSDAKGLTMGYYHTSQLPLATEAKDFTICDHFFHAAFGGSFLNHQFLIAAQAPTFPVEQAMDAGRISSVFVPLDGGSIGNDGFVTPDGYAVNTCYSVNQPHPSKPLQQLVPNQTNTTIGDLLNDAGIDWKWYSGGYAAALSGDAGSKFQFHHQPFVYYQNYADGTAAKAAHLKDETDFFADIDAGTLPPVAFWKPYGLQNEHPGYTDVLTGEQYVENVLTMLKASGQYKDMAIIITYDENGGFWDHVPPPVVDKWGPGTRVPTIVVSPFAKKGHVDNTVYDTTSILATIEHRYGLPALGVHDAHFPDMSNSFDFTQTP